jgi:hypothetical protein
MFNILRVLFVWKKMDMQPFTYKSIVAIAIGLICYLVVLLLPGGNNDILAIMIRNAVLIGLFLTLILSFRVADDFNLFFTQIRARVLKKQGK